MEDNYKRAVIVRVHEDHVHRGHDAVDAESIADVYVCRYCEEESIRWNKAFLKRHPEMGELKTG